MNPALGSCTSLFRRGRGLGRDGTVTNTVETRKTTEQRKRAQGPGADEVCTPSGPGRIRRFVLQPHSPLSPGLGGCQDLVRLSGGFSVTKEGWRWGRGWTGAGDGKYHGPIMCDYQDGIILTS